MSAIVGVFNRDDEPLDPLIIRHMLDAIACYGPDGRDFRVDGNIGLGHLALHITPESATEKLPARRDNLFITADARIDNRQELLDTLSGRLAAHQSQWEGVAANAPAAGNYDRAPATAQRATHHGLRRAEQAQPGAAAIILTAYEQWGEDCPVHLIGDFAFAIWDRRRQVLFLAGDHIGARPLYYYATPRRFIFASDVRALLAHPDVPCAAAEPVVAAYLAKFPFVPQHETFYKGVFKLPAGHLLRVDAREYRARRYWFPFDLPPLRLRGEAEYVAALRDLLQQAVACRVRTEQPVAAHLSGGLDSTGVAVLAARELGRRGRKLVAGYSWAPAPSPETPLAADDNRRLIDEVGQLEGIPIQYLTLAGRDFLTYLKRQPNVGAAPGYAQENVVLRHAAASGVRVILSGWGGNEAISSGQTALAGLLVRGRLIRAGSELLRLRGSVAFKRLLLLQLTICLPDALYYRLKPDRMAAQETYVAADFAACGGEYARPLFRLLPGVRRTQRYMFAHANLPAVPALWAALGAEYGVTYAYPLLDRRVLEFAYTVPEDLFLRRSYGRYLYRAAMRGILPAALAWQRSNMSDPQVEARYGWWCAAWQELGQEVRSGDWDDDVPWLDMPRLRARLLNAPDEAWLRANWQQFIALAHTVEMFYLYRFFHTAKNDQIS